MGKSDTTGKVDKFETQLKFLLWHIWHNLSSFGITKKSRYRSSWAIVGPCRSIRAFVSNSASPIIEGGYWSDTIQLHKLRHCFFPDQSVELRAAKLKGDAQDLNRFRERSFFGTSGDLSTSVIGASADYESNWSHNSDSLESLFNGRINLFEKGFL